MFAEDTWVAPRLGHCEQQQLTRVCGHLWGVLPLHNPGAGPGAMLQLLSHAGFAFCFWGGLNVVLEASVGSL